jgi:hypothetical protein
MHRESHGNSNHKNPQYGGTQPDLLVLVLDPQSILAQEFRHGFLDYEHLHHGYNRIQLK